METVQYNGPERTIGERVWYPGETRQATKKQLAAWRAEHGDVFALVGGEPDIAPADAAGDSVDDDKSVAKKKVAK